MAKLCAHGAAQLQDEPHVWVVFDGSDVRKPHARQMEHLQRVRRLEGSGTVPGYATRNVLGIGRERRGILTTNLARFTAGQDLMNVVDLREGY